MTMGESERLQEAFSHHLRHPGVHPAPAGIEDRRLAIYRDLIYNNIEGFIAGGFPVLREILDDDRWHALVRDFVSTHRSRSPYFLEISQEFLAYLQNERQGSPDDPPFLLELAHYEWVELALDVAEGELPAARQAQDLLGGRVQVSPLLWCLSYRYPVHRLGPDFQPMEPPPEPTFLLVYRNRAEQVEFMLSNNVTVRLIKILQAGTESGESALRQLAQEMQHPDPAQLIEHGAGLLEELSARDILWAE